MRGLCTFIATQVMLVTAIVGPIEAQADRPVIVLDPGHGGIDPGAVRGEHREADLMLAFARELAEALVRSGRFQVRLTRDADDFLRLSERVGVARKAQAFAFLSFHADALTQGRARGASVYTLSDRASDATAAELVEAQDRADLLSGQDLSETDDAIAGILVDLARTDTRPRSQALAGHLLGALEGEFGHLHTDSGRSAGFGVLKSPDIPSVLVELGFMSDARDLENLTSGDWRKAAAVAIRNGLIAWADADAVAAARRRN